MAYAVEYLKYMADWSLMGVDFLRAEHKAMLPIGTCVEGIRVEFVTPGYKDPTILAIANIKNSKYQTNVARSSIELDANNEILSDIYDVYKEYVQDQMDNLEQKGYAQSWALSEGKYLMRPLVDSVFSIFSSQRVEPIDEDVLIQRLAHLKCLALENNGERKIVSADQVANLDEINIFECEMTRAAEHLLKEVRSNATLSNLISVVCEDDFLKNSKNVICDIDGVNMLHQYALKNKEVSRIEVTYDQRRIRLTYVEKKNSWYAFDMIADRIRSSGLERMSRTLYIPKKDVPILGLKNEIGVRTSNGIYIRGDTELCEYLRKMIDKFQEDDTDENKLALQIFLSSVFDYRMLEVAHKADVNASRIFKDIWNGTIVSSEVMEKKWAQIDMEEFGEKILKKNYTLYSIDNWMRDK